MDIELLWSKSLPINIITPEGEKGKHGIFAFVYDKREIVCARALKNENKN